MIAARARSADERRIKVACKDDTIEIKNMLLFFGVEFESGQYMIQIDRSDCKRIIDLLCLPWMYVNRTSYGGLSVLVLGEFPYSAWVYSIRKNVKSKMRELDV
jgi:hypothetical protein